MATGAGDKETSGYEMPLDGELRNRGTVSGYENRLRILKDQAERDGYSLMTTKHRETIENYAQRTLNCFHPRCQVNARCVHLARFERF